MSKITFEESKKMDWSAAYSYVADKLFLSKRIPSTARPKTVEENIVLYIDESGRSFGLIFEYFWGCFYKKKGLRKILKYIENKQEKEIVEIPYQRKFIEPIFSVFTS